MIVDLVDSVWRAHHDRALRLGLNLARECSTNGDVLLTAVGIAESYLGHASQATSRYHLAIELQDSPDIVASTICRLAHTLSCMGRIKAAEAVLSDPEIDQIAKRHPLLYARLQATHGAIAHRAGHPERALRYYSVAAAVLVNTDCLSGRAHVQADMSLAYSDLGHEGTALWLAEHARDTFCDLDSPSGAANAANTCAIALMRKGRLDEAERICRDTLRCVSFEAPRLLAVLLGTLGEIESRRGRYQHAAETLAGAALAAESVPMITASIAEVHLHLGFALGALGVTQGALTQWSRACEILLVLGNDVLLKQYRARIEAANKSLVEDLRRIGDRARAISGAVELERLLT